MFELYLGMGKFDFLDRGGNQGYQIDTLPIVLKPHEMKPGDLVFYSGIYNNENKRVSKHNMTHVEMFTGGETGTQSIGARGKKKVVNYYDSFKFVSRSYHSIKWHYRSIDTWLEGSCKSICPKHKWKRGKRKPNYSTANIIKHKKMKQRVKYMEHLKQNKKVIPKAITAFVNKVYCCPEFESVLENCNIKILTSEALEPNQWNDEARFAFVSKLKEVDYARYINDFHFVNHIQTRYKPCSPKGFLKLIEHCKTSMKCGVIKPIDDYEDAFIEGYCLDNVSDLWTFLNCSNEGMWVVKKCLGAHKRISYKNIVTNLMAYKETLLSMDPEEDYWLKEGNIEDDDFSISDIEEEEDEDTSSSNLNSNSDQDDIEDDVSESDHDDSDQDQSDEPEETKNETMDVKVNDAEKMNPNLPRMYKRNKRLLKNIATELRNRTIFKQVVEYRPKKSFRKSSSMPRFMKTSRGREESKKNDNNNLLIDETKLITYHTVTTICRGHFVSLINSHEAEKHLKRLKVDSYKSRRQCSTRPNSSSSYRESSEEEKGSSDDSLGLFNKPRSIILNERMKDIVKVLLHEMSFHMNSKIRGCFEMLRFNFVIDSNLNPVLKGISSNLNDERLSTDYSKQVIESSINFVFKLSKRERAKTKENISKLILEVMNSAGIHKDFRFLSKH
ncbi:unnamed protein product [Moneuplotes crassus]|uniref:Uncharacterized protein n=1 Tax=Euplotes crassus TaxID=5936 RepID=A0AAD1XWD8_EUPCR|nr:unnamed protein product [Moneuplotes crassus]